MLSDDPSNSFTLITDAELSEHILRIKQDLPDVGYNMMRGLLRAQGVHVSTIRIQQCQQEVDPINTALRWAAPVSRRVVWSSTC